eukprot:GHRQ01034894.1.p1 GENE.GHRQ01034894.1~~GHRQ01034894.1.p1  ORF type:complete len:214 (+),score=49.27 GHRQ01034894.1:290-931(+)
MLLPSDAASMIHQQCLHACNTCLQRSHQAPPPNTSSNSTHHTAAAARAAAHLAVPERASLLHCRIAANDAVLEVAAVTDADVVHQDAVDHLYIAAKPAAMQRQQHQNVTHHVPHYAATCLMIRCCGTKHFWQVKHSTLHKNAKQILEKASPACSLAVAPHDCSLDAAFVPYYAVLANNAPGPNLQPAAASSIRQSKIRQGDDQCLQPNLSGLP